MNSAHTEGAMEIFMQNDYIRFDSLVLFSAFIQNIVSFAFRYDSIEHQFSIERYDFRFIHLAVCFDI